MVGHNDSLDAIMKNQKKALVLLADRLSLGRKHVKIFSVY